MPTNTKMPGGSPAANSATNEIQQHFPAELGSLPGQPVVGPDRIRPRSVNPYRGDVLADVAMTILQKQSPKIRDLARVVSGEIDELDAPEYRSTMISLVKCACGASLDLIGERFGASRGETIHKSGRAPETDVAYAKRLIELIEVWPAPWSVAESLVGISLRTVLHFHPRATLTQQEAAIEKTIQAVKREIVYTEVDETFRISDLWFVVRFTAQDVVIDVGDPNRPF